MTDRKGSSDFVTITRTDSNRGPSHISIHLRVDGHDTHVTMSLEDFALAVTGMGRVPVTPR